MQQIYRFFVFSNLLIALAATAQCLLSYHILGHPPRLPILVIEGASTLLLYNFSLWLSKPKEPQQSPYLRTRWVFGHLRLFWVNNFIAGLMLGYALLHVSGYTILFLGVVGVVSLMYNLPLFSFNGRRSGLRQIPGMKLFHIAVVWSLSGVGLPVAEMWAAGLSVDWMVANYLGLLKILFLIICTLPFDIRDMERDSYYHLKTIPHLVGKQRAQHLCYILLILHMVLITLAPYSSAIKIGLILTDMLIGLALRFLVFNRASSYHPVYLLDLALIIQYLCVFLFMYLAGVSS